MRIGLGRKRVYSGVAVPAASDRDRMEALFASTKDELYGFVLSRCGDPALAEEVVGDTYVAAVQAADTGTTSAADLSVGWLVTVARRRLIDHWRRQSRHRRGLVQLMAGQMTEIDGPEESAVIERDEEALRALRSLPERQRAAVTMRYLDEMSVGEIAQALDVSYKTAESLLSRGRSGLREAYTEALDG